MGNKYCCFLYKGKEQEESIDDSKFSLTQEAIVDDIMYRYQEEIISLIQEIEFLKEQNETIKAENELLMIHLKEKYPDAEITRIRPIPRTPQKIFFSERYDSPLKIIHSEKFVERTNEVIVKMITEGGGKGSAFKKVEPLKED